MEKEFIGYEQALALKELGFDEPCFGYYDPLLGDYLIMNSDCINPKPSLFNHNSSSVVVSALLYQQAFRWFREKYKLISSVDIAEEETEQEHYFVTITTQGSYGSFKTYEEAELECLKKLIEIVKEKNQ